MMIKAQVNAAEVIEIEKLKQGRAGVWFLNWNVTSKPLVVRRKESSESYKGPGVYAIGYDGYLIYIGSYLGKGDKKTANFSGDVVKDRWCRHIATITCRGHLLHTAKRNLSILQGELDLNHVMIDGFLRGNPNQLHNDAGANASLRRLRFAAKNSNDFHKINTSSEDILKRFTFIYIRFERIPNNINGKSLKTTIEASEVKLIKHLAPICNTKHVPRDKEAIPMPISEAVKLIEVELKSAVRQSQLKPKLMLKYQLTKTKVKAGLQCHKKLWYDINDRIIEKSHILKLGNRFGDHIKAYYGSGVDLTDQFGFNLLELTLDAINDPSVNVIYEAAFLYDETLIRADVLIRDGMQWQLIEAKASTGLREDHLKDAAIQAFVIINSHVSLSRVKIAHINSSFIYQGQHDYDGLVIEVNVDNEIAGLTPLVQEWISELLPIAEVCSGIPNVQMGNQCKDDTKRKCIYFDRCESQTYLGSVAVPIKILPNIGERLQNSWFDRGIYDLCDLPANTLNNQIHQKIQFCHQQGVEWINPELINTIDSYEWPRYFIDFETIQQGVPLIAMTTPYEAFPFQFSVHKWEFQDQILTLEDSHSFLEFDEAGMDRKFLVNLIEVLGDQGPIFTHRSSTEITAMKKLADREDCIDLRPAIDRIITRTIDTLTMVRNGFYNPKMMGSFSLKDIVKVLKNADAYNNEGDAVGDGGGAMIKWFEYTEPKATRKAQETIRENLVKYCAQDTLNLYHLFKYISTCH